uniref:Uncharacterized protein n=1 Tax=Octopus bimaculoides TaxID=37653 RepID=A0A0L8ICR5_OCTBM
MSSSEASVANKRNHYHHNPCTTRRMNRVNCLEQQLVREQVIISILVLILLPLEGRKQTCL